MAVSSPQLGRPVGASGEATRRRIIDAAMRCVAEVGYSRATIREIARTADITSGSLYHYFANKSELLTATVDTIREIALPRLRAAAQNSADIVERLDAVLDESDRLLRDYPHLAGFERAMRIERTAHPGTDPGYDGFAVLHDVIEDIVADARRQGNLAAGTNPRAAVDAICALTRGLTEQAALLGPDAHHATMQAAKRIISGTLF